MNYEKIQGLLDSRGYKELKEEMEKYYPVDIAALLEEVDEKEMLILFRLLAKEEAAETFTYMNSDMRETLIDALTDSELEEVMDEMYLDDTVDVLEEMPANVVERLLLATDEDTRKQINTILQYPEDSAGSVMNVDYVGLRPDMTVADAILKIRQVGINKETIYTLYITEKRKLLGVVDIKDLLTSGEGRTMEEIMDTNILYAHTTDDQEDVAKTIKKYGLVAIPIVDHESCMVGIVTVDDAMLVLQDETTEDISIMAGVSPNEESYFGTSVFQHAKNRSTWLMFLMLSATLTGMVLGHYEAQILALPVLNTFIPMLTGTGGNCGSQSSTLIIRGLAVGEVRFKDAFRVIFKEVRVALLVGAFLAVVNGVRILIMYHDRDPLPLAVALGITLMGTILMAKTVGCTLPLIAKKCGLDPAIMAAPLITTLVDTGTTIIYFQVAMLIFPQLRNL
ncbi:magnesium transporter [Bariatricus massiliensis]|uniref:Magnesium transporter MgtE n=1 Tax=Bariatricus massiliensis TaxID=1745713 RepID=A0ABS8DC73_9FIRM|nr:magnesium transporter [Bariatricus massiliensis]MCB7303208.1 magnesium transporter [Bariatricus massiliensis]MCB7373340.1 magnesium transporter [Bariatricus massiliensis]MCB7386010.1 magnesium transporter [Bariatricus massiliensis]MCB7410172.1 magnesium transporter [Bariatricus massiliensis]MCQ5252544.1 magnesium transporter [Bariatricus massiliensis]